MATRKPKGKDPAILLYTADFLTGTMFMTNEQVGLYIRMLCAQHQHGGYVDANVMRTQCARITDGDAVLSKFTLSEHGYQNTRMAAEMERRAEKSLKNSESANKRWTHTNANAHANAVRSEIENESETIKGKERESAERETIGIGNNQKYYQQSTDDVPWLEAFCRAVGTPTIEHAKIMVREFFIDQEPKQEYHANLRAWRKHAVDWSKLQKRNNGTKQTRSEQLASQTEQTIKRVVSYGFITDKEQ